LSLAAAGDMGFGDDDNRPRRSAWLESLGFNPGRAASVNLVHSRSVVIVNDPADSRGVEADGLVTRGLAEAEPSGPSCLVITVADCMPIYLYDEGSGAYGLLHSGWQGTGILTEAMRLMKSSFGTRAADVSAVFGPRIGSCCYLVDEARADAFSRKFGANAVLRSDEHQGKPRLDLVAANMTLAERAGIGRVDVMDDCTACDVRFGSFRRQGPTAFTRMAAVIGYVSVAGQE
ncbi:MAG: polyphenol oxidase family protein, partial [Spirochaetales bacterium]|nr:polyphenol oxidase family protein [Spirochaetales bacterium]